MVPGQEASFEVTQAWVRILVLLPMGSVTSVWDTELGGSQRSSVWYG